MTEIYKFGQGFQRWFRQVPNDYLDKELLVILKKAKLNMVKFDAFLCGVEGYNEDDSMAENVERLFGKGAVEFVEKYL